MKKLSISMLLTLGAFGVPATNIGCGGSGGGGGGAVKGHLLMPSADGFIALDTNEAGVYGDWYNPGAGTGDCAVKGMYPAETCSSITMPIPGEVFTNTGGKMCTTGTAAKVIDMNYSAIWGTGIGFDTNNGGADVGGTKMPWDAVANGITGLQFEIDTPPTGGQMRVEFPTSVIAGTTDINAAYWGGATANLSPFTKGGTYAFHWKDVGGPMYLTSPTPFDASKILSVQFHVVTNTSSTIPFSYCISNVYALTD
jgi:hypothetical protein